MTDELLIRFLLNETNEAEGLAVREWLDADPANLRYFRQFETIWKASKELAPASPRDEQQAWQRFQQRAAAAAAGQIAEKPAPAVRKMISETPETNIKPLKPGFGWLKAAAVLLLVGGAWMLYSIFGPERYKDLVAENRVLTEQLPDGSELTLNKNAEVSYAANFEQHRSVRLNKGEVFFEVAHDKSRPFVIDIDQVSVTVVGTSFNIRKQEGQTEVIVESGVVRVALGKEEVELRKGEKIRIAAAVPVLRKELSTDQLYNYYRSNFFIANNTPLKNLTDVMNEAYGSRIVISDPDLAAEPFNTRFKVDDGLEENLKLICSALNLHMERNENKILLSRMK